MSDEKWLRQAAEEIRKEGHYGWGNTCEQAADRIAELEAYKAKLEALRDVMASLIALFAAEPPRTDANIARILFERCVYWYGVDSSVPVTLDSITNLQCGECHLNVGEICDICGAMGEGK